MLEWPPVLKNKSPLKVQINVYTISIIKKDKMYSKVFQICKIENEYSNINRVYTMFKGTMILIIEVWKRDGKINFPIIECY